MSILEESCCRRMGWYLGLLGKAGAVLCVKPHRPGEHQTGICGQCVQTMSSGQVDK